jgi:chaperonin GroES
MKKKTKKKPAPKKSSFKAKVKQAVSPLGDRVLVKPMAAETVTSFGIIIPDNAKEKPEQGTVVAVGPGKKTDDGKLIPVSVKVGERVMFSKYGYDEVKINGVEYYLVSEANLLAVLN